MKDPTLLIVFAALVLLLLVLRVAGAGKRKLKQVEREREEIALDQDIKTEKDVMNVYEGIDYQVRVGKTSEIQELKLVLPRLRNIITVIYNDKKYADDKKDIMALTDAVADTTSQIVVKHGHMTEEDISEYSAMIKMFEEKLDTIEDRYNEWKRAKVVAELAN